MINEEQLKIEIQHIFDSGANEIRVFEMVKDFISSRNIDNDKTKELKAENELLSNRLKGFKLHYQVDEINKDLSELSHLANEMANDLIEASEFFDGTYESLAAYKNWEQKQNLIR